MSARSEARAAGVTVYFTGRPCPRGHLAMRYASNGTCADCTKAQTKDQVEAGYFKGHYAANAQRMLRVQRDYYQANRAQGIARARVWQERNPERVSQYKRKNKHMRRAAVGVFQQSDVQALLRIQRGECAGCHSRLDNFHLDHIIPLSRGGTNWCGNLQLLCPHCNLTKSDLLPIAWRCRINSQMLAA